MDSDLKTFFEHYLKPCKIGTATKLLIWLYCYCQESGSDILEVEPKVLAKEIGISLTAALTTLDTLTWYQPATAEKPVLMPLTPVQGRRRGGPVRYQIYLQGVTPD